MTLYNIYGRLVGKTVNKYRVKWDKPSRSKFQFKVKQLLKPIWITDVVFEEFPVFGSLLKIDFYNATRKVAIEVNGPQHDKFHFFHDGSPQKFIKAIKYDLRKYEWCEKNQIKLIEIVEKDLLNIADFYSLIKNANIITPS